MTLKYHTKASNFQCKIKLLPWHYVSFLGSTYTSLAWIIDKHESGGRVHLFDVQENINLIRLH